MRMDIAINNEHILEYFPNFEYFNCTEPERLNFFKTNNIVGSQQRAFVLYHILQEVQRSGYPGLSLACGQVIEPFTIGIDHYYGDKHPIYGGGYYPQLTCECEKLPFNDNTVDFVVAAHAFEHMKNSLETFKEWIRIIKQGGALIMVIPDANFERRSAPWDSDHRNFYTPTIFKREILDPCDDLIKTEVFDTLNNFFSFNYVGRKQ